MILEFKVDELSVQSAWLKTLYELIDELNCKCQTFMEEKYNTKKAAIPNNSIEQLLWI